MQTNLTYCGSHQLHKSSADHQPCHVASHKAGVKAERHDVKISAEAIDAGNDYAWAVLLPTANK